MTFSLPNLNYAKNALSPNMSEETLDLHHGKHHQTYITNLNNLIKDTPFANNSLEEIIKQTAKDASKAGIFNNAGQHWNHILFWNCMKPKGGGAMPADSNPLVDNMKPIFGCDVWEHSYYVDYRNRRPDYLKAFVNELANWEFVASQLN